MPSRTTSCRQTPPRQHLAASNGSEGQAIRKWWQIAKQGALDEEEVTDDAELDDDDALERIEELAAEQRRRNPKLSKGTGVREGYNPANAYLAALERIQNRPG